MAEPAEIARVSLSLTEQLPVLQVVVPFVTAPLIVLIGSRRAAWWLAFGSAAITFAIAAALLATVHGGGSLSYQIGGWLPPVGIEYRIDAAGALVLFLIAGIGLLVLPFARESVAAELSRRDHTLFYACYMLCLTGLLGMVATGDAFNVFVFLEISSLSTYVLVAMGARRDRRALTAAYDYLIMGTIGATFFVIGIGFLFMATGTLNMADMAAVIAENGSNRTIQAGFAFILVGMGLKAALVPLHLWLPNAYTYAPSAVTAFLSATATKASVYVMLRFIFSVYTPEHGYAVNALHLILVPLALVAMFGASVMAIFQRDFKRMLAYSSVAQIGYMLLGFAMLNATGVSATMVHLFNHGITKAALFMAVGAIVLRTGSSYYDDMNGIGRQMPVTGAVIVIGGLSLIGVPGTAGFISKWMLVQAAFEEGFWPVALLIVLSSLLAVVYVWRVIEVIFLEAPGPLPPTGGGPDGDGAATAPPRDPSAWMLGPMLILAAACVWFGIFTTLPLGAAVTAGETLMSGPLVMAEPSAATSALPTGAASGAADEAH